MARVTVYLPNYLHKRWREEYPDTNLSQLTQYALYESMTAAGDEEVVILCQLCRRRAGEAMRTKKRASTNGEVHTEHVSAPKRKPRSAAS